MITAAFLGGAVIADGEFCVCRCKFGLYVPGIDHLFAMLFVVSTINYLDDIKLINLII